MPENLIERREIQIPQGAKVGPENRPMYGYVTVPAYCMGGLAVHKTDKGAHWKWHVTHESSGLALTRIGANTKARALENMHMALQIGIDWTQDEARTLAALRETRGFMDAINAIANRD